LDFVPQGSVYVAPPPDISSVMADMAPGRLLEVLQTVGLHGQRTDYIHWDKLRQLKPPDGITPEEWWMAIRMSRGGQLTRLPLRDVKGTAFGYQTPPEALRGLHYIDQHCSGEIAMDEVVTSDHQARHHYLVSSLMEEAIRSSQLEGATTSRRIAKELLRTGRPPRDRSETMILNNYRALEFMRDDMGDHLTPELVMTLQRILTEGTLDDPSGAGRLQTPDEDRVVVLDATDGTVMHRPPPADQLPERLRAMCDFANETADADGVFIHPVVRAIMLHFWLAYDHPFQDGNGRTSRALFYWYLRTKKYWLIEYLSISRVLRKAPSKYARAFLFTETDQGDATYFLLHQLDVIERAVAELQTYLKRKVKEVKDVEQLIKGAEAFNHRQLALLGDAIRHPDHSYSYQSHATSHRVTHETARTDLVGLQEHGLLERRRLNRKHLYTPVSDLPEVLKAL
jgi:Fic family protein